MLIDITITFAKEKDLPDGETELVEEWLLTQDTRHGKTGWCAARYIHAFRARADALEVVEKSFALAIRARARRLVEQRYKDYSPEELRNTMEWDEQYMFFYTLDAAHKTFESLYETFYSVDEILKHARKAF